MTNGSTYCSSTRNGTRRTANGLLDRGEVGTDKSSLKRSVCKEMERDGVGEHQENALSAEGSRG